MEIVFDRESQVAGKIRVKIDRSDYEAGLGKKVKEYSKKVTIKGFRPGKVPEGMVYKLYGKSILVEEINSILGENLNKYIRDNNLPIIGDPLPNEDKHESNNWDNPSDFEFSFDLGLIPDFDIPFKKIKLNKYSIKTDNQTIEDTIVDLKARFGTTENLEISSEGDFIYGKIREVNGSYENNALISPKRANKSEMGAFVGKKPGDIIDFDIFKLFDGDKKSVASFSGIEADKLDSISNEFRMEIERITRTMPAEMNQEFYDKVFGAEKVNDEAGFRQMVENQIAENYDAESNAYLSKQLRDEVIAATKIDLPEGFLKRWIKLKNEGELTDNQIEEQFEGYLSDLRWNIVKNKVAKDHSLEVKPEEVSARAGQILMDQFASYGLLSQIADKMDTFVQNYLTNEDGKNFKRIYEKLHDEKCLEVIKPQVTITEKSVTLDEFKKQIGAIE